MSDLRKASEALINHWEAGEFKNCTGNMAGHIQVLREALAQSDDLQTAMERGTQAWADVPADWVEELRGNDTPEVTGEVTTEVPCKTHPDAPHGFNRSASFDEDRYVCDCEFWEPDVDNVHISEERVPTTDKSINEPTGWVKIDEVRQYLDSVGCGTIYKTAGEGRVPLYSAPYTKNDTTAGVLHKEWVGLSEDEFEKILETHNEAMPFAVYLSIEAKLKEKNT